MPLFNNSILGTILCRGAAKVIANELAEEELHRFLRHPRHGRATARGRVLIEWLVQKSQTHNSY